MGSIVNNEKLTALQDWSEDFFSHFQQEENEKKNYDNFLISKRQQLRKINDK
ncbi:MAG: hypothetical protein AAGA80_04720 [Cyanobacteria bacterium P01_F01_bin.143]